jgi:hypothetical protein
MKRSNEMKANNEISIENESSNENQNMKWQRGGYQALRSGENESKIISVNEMAKITISKWRQK